MFRLHYAASPEEAAATFPWGYVNVTLDDYSWAFPGNWNPAPTLLKNGSLRVMAHDSWRSMAGTAIFQSHGVANYAGPFRLITDDQAPGWVGDTHGTEDNFYWVDAAGNHHVLYHWLAGHAWNGPTSNLVLVPRAICPSGSWCPTRWRRRRWKCRWTGAAR